MRQLARKTKIEPDLMAQSVPESRPASERDGESQTRP
jgi:hypothetical protein